MAIHIKAMKAITQKYKKPLADLESLREKDFLADKLLGRGVDKSVVSKKVEKNYIKAEAIMRKVQML